MVWVGVWVPTTIALKFHPSLSLIGSSKTWFRTGFVLSAAQHEVKKKKGVENNDKCQSISQSNWRNLAKKGRKFN